VSLHRLPARWRSRTRCQASVHSVVLAPKCRLTPPSSGRPKAGFAIFVPPLMSNVGPHGRELLEHAAPLCQSVEALRAIREVGAGRPSCGGRRTVVVLPPNRGQGRSGLSVLRRPAHGGCHLSGSSLVGVAAVASAVKPRSLGRARSHQAGSSFAVRLRGRQVTTQRQRLPVAGKCKHTARHARGCVIEFKCIAVLSPQAPAASGRVAPNPSIERTAQKLRFWSAAHVER